MKLTEITGDKKFDDMLKDVSSKKLSKNAQKRELKVLKKNNESVAEIVIAKYMEVENRTRAIAIDTIDSHIAFFGIKNFADRNNVDPDKFKAEWLELTGSTKGNQLTVSNRDAEAIKKALKK